MIFSKLKYIAAFFATSLLLISCAKESSESSRASELRLLNSTKETFFPKDKYPNSRTFDGYDDGSLWLISHSQVGSGDTPKNGDYVAYDFTGKLLPISGSYVFQTTDSTLARRLGTFKYDTHFAPMYYCDTPTVMLTALIEALKLMHVGDTVTVMSASWLAYGSAGASSFNGETSLAANVPVIFSMVLKKIVPDPKKRESDMVENYVKAHPEKEFVLAKDNEGNELEGFYISYVDTVPLDSGYHYAATDDSVHVKYEGHYVEDNFLLDTNIDSVAKKNNWTITTTDSTYLGFAFSETAAYTAVKPFLHYALLRVAPGSWVEAVFTSDYGYGSTENSGVATRRVFPYTPLRFRIYVARISSGD